MFLMGEIQTKTTTYVDGPDQNGRNDPDKGEGTYPKDAPMFRNAPHWGKGKDLRVIEGEMMER